MITFGKKELISKLKALWIEVFGDSEEYVNAFFEHVYQNENAIAFVEGNEIMAALYMIPYRIKDRRVITKELQLMAAEREEYQAVYLYALATKKSERNKGIMSKLIWESQKISRERAYQYQFLIPSEEQIKNYYKKFGFEVFACRTKGMLSADDLKEKKEFFLIDRNEMKNNDNIQIISSMRAKILNDIEERTLFIEKVLM